MNKRSSWHYGLWRAADGACLPAACSHTLQDVVALIAYEQPEASPLAHLLQLSQREVVADVVNAAILVAASPQPPPDCGDEEPDTRGFTQVCGW
jgi:hypothetical protein